MAERRDSQLVDAVLRACALLKAFRFESEHLRLRDFVSRTHQSKTTTHRLLQTLQSAGFIERIGSEHYRTLIKPVGKPTVRIGFAAQTVNSTFSSLVTESIKRAAAQAGVDLVTVNNQYSAKVALRNAETLIRENVDLVLEFQTYARVAPIISSRFLGAGIPVIAIEIPHPGATFFGANNYQAGLIGGRAMAKWAQERWQGRVEELVLLEEQVAGPFAELRVAGMTTNLRKILPEIEQAHTTELDGKGALGPSFEVMQKYLRRMPRRRTLVAASNDPMALGALRAFEECGRSDLCGVLGHNALPEARQELRRRGTSLIGSVAYFPERYGDELIPLALSLLAGKPTPSAKFTKHILMTPANVDEIYPLDQALRDSIDRPLLDSIDHRPH